MGTCAGARQAPVADAGSDAGKGWPRVSGRREPFSTELLGKRSWEDFLADRLS